MVVLLFTSRHNLPAQTNVCSAISRPIVKSIVIIRKVCVFYRLMVFFHIETIRISYGFLNLPNCSNKKKKTETTVCSWLFHSIISLSRTRSEEKQFIILQYCIETVGNLGSGIDTRPLDMQKIKENCDFD